MKTLETKEERQKRLDKARIKERRLSIFLVSFALLVNIANIYYWVSMAL